MPYRMKMMFQMGVPKYYFFIKYLFGFKLNSTGCKTIGIKLR